MTDITTENSAFTKIVDATYDSKVLSGLVAAGILPPTFRVIKATADVSSAAAGDNVPFLDATTGQQVVLGEQQAILYAALYASATLTSGGSPTLSVGLATAADGANSTNTLLFTNGVAATTPLPIADANTGVSSLIVNMALVGYVPVLRGITQSTLANGTFLQAQVNTAALTAGELTIILVVV